MTTPRSRSPSGINLHRFAEEFGIKVRPYREARSPRPANVIYGGRTVVRLMKKDSERCRVVLAAIQASNPHCFEDKSILAVWHFVGAHLADRPSREVASLFSTIDLAAIQRRAQILAAGKHGRMEKTVSTITALLADKLLEIDAA